MRPETEIDSLRAKLAEAEGRVASTERRLGEVEKERDQYKNDMLPHAVESLANWQDMCEAAEARVAELEKERDAATTSQAEDLMTCVSAVQKSEAREALLREALESVYEKIAHGDDEHRAWLKAMVCEIVNAALEKAKP